MNGRFRSMRSTALVLEERMPAAPGEGRLVCAEREESVSLPDSSGAEERVHDLRRLHHLGQRGALGLGSLEMSTSRSTGASLAVIFFSATGRAADFSARGHHQGDRDGRSMGGAYSMRERSPDAGGLRSAVEAST